MTKQEKQETEAKLKLEENDREVFRRTFGSEDGIQVLTWILNECGRWSCDPEKIIPELQALGNRLLAKLGVVHEWNLFELVRKYTEAANDNDIFAIRGMMSKEEEKEE
jgi:hypothetical protein